MFQELCMCVCVCREKAVRVRVRVGIGVLTGAVEQLRYSKSLHQMLLMVQEYHWGPHL